MPAERKRVKKYTIEYYRNYKICVVSGIEPLLFNAVYIKDGICPTLTEDDIDRLHDKIDDVLKNAKRIGINAWVGAKEKSMVVNNTKARIKSVYNIENCTAIVFSDYDLCCRLAL